MSAEEKITGSKVEFDENWRTRKEASYNHWTHGRPKNQIQLAFRSHWQVFQELLGDATIEKGSVLEVGCGRGSLSSYFAEAGWDTTLLDSSQQVLETAQSIFTANNHSARFVLGDANALEFPDESFDVTCSIGLLEHFEDVRTPIAEQLRVLKPGGWFLGYVVPERPDNLQQYFNWVNRVLSFIVKVFGSRQDVKTPKSQVFRSDKYSDHYIDAMHGLEYERLTIFGMYSMPMISHSPEFPFSLLPAPIEWLLTRIFEFALVVRRLITGRHGWICSEQMGQAFLLAFQKPPK